MYWKEVPVQVQAVDDAGAVSKPLEPRFQEAADAIAMFDGSAGTDEYMMAWEWGAFEESDGPAEAAAEAAAKSINLGMPSDFVARIRDLHLSGDRDPSPGGIDHWMNNDRD
jgi:hypothetical protein